MDSSSDTSIVEKSAAIAEVFAEGLIQLKRWRKIRGANKAVGQQELEDCLIKCQSAVNTKCATLSRQYGVQFERGDTPAHDCLTKIKLELQQTLVHKLKSDTAERGLSANPLEIYRDCEAAKRKTMEAMDELAQRIHRANQSSQHKKINPDDVLPSFPAPEKKKSYANLQRPPPQVPQVSQFPPVPIRPVYTLTPPPSQNQIMPLATPNEPSYADKFQGFSQALIRRISSSSTLSSVSTTRSSTSLPPMESYAPVPDIQVVFSKTEDPNDILEESQAVVDGLRASADRIRKQSSQEQWPRSAPLVQGPWTSRIFNEILADPPPKITKTTPTSPASSLSSLDLSPKIESLPFQPPGKRLSAPEVKFSNPSRRYARAVSGL